MRRRGDAWRRGGADFDFRLLVPEITTPSLGAPPLLNQEGSYQSLTAEIDLYQEPAVRDRRYRKKTRKSLKILEKPLDNRFAKTVHSVEISGRW